ncbi:hypothetical protein [Mycobacterium sp. BK086]|uniref:hypothetical protein n=1 Tax=Mycobacterium sp. BK086 TaxID=2512165 RepID=UPI001AACF390|nr:hypothetical protein [Mycobacterium sp. BK086]
MAAYLLVIGDRDALGWILSEGRTAFPEARQREVSSVSIGDEFFLYTTRGAFRNPTRDRGRVIGTASVTSNVGQLRESVSFNGRDYPVGCDLEVGRLAPLGRGVELAPLVTGLDAFKDAGNAWAIRLRRPLLRLTEYDACLLSGVLNEVDRSFEARREYTRWFVDSRSRGRGHR